MNYKDKALIEIEGKVENGERISESEAANLFRSEDILGLGRLADKIRGRKAGNVVTLVGNYHISYSNVCEKDCRECIFRRDPHDEDAFILNMEEIERLAEESKKSKMPEILILGGIHPGLNFGFALQVLRRIKDKVPQVKILAFSPVEIEHFCELENKPPAQILTALREAGLSAVTGGGAEIFSPRVRAELGCENKISGKRWLEIMEAAHGQRVYSNASMLYGAGETYEERIEHMRAIREVQDRTGGFTHFLPFAYSKADRPRTTGFDDMKMIAVSRIFFDNFDHIRAYWSHLGLHGAQLALAFGADDLNGLRQKGRIIHSSGGGAFKQTDRETMIAIIKDAGRIPAERDILFNIVEKFS